MLAETYAKGLITKRQASPLKACFKGDRALMGSLADYQIQFEAPEKTPDPLKIPRTIGLYRTNGTRKVSSYGSQTTTTANLYELSP